MTLFTPWAFLLLALGALMPYATAEPQSNKSDAVDIRTDFSGGNALVKDIKGDTVYIAPDLRGDREWFYWYFEVRANRPGRVTFSFPPTVAGFKDGAIGFQGPAVSDDLGKTWKWMGIDNGRGNSFFYDFIRDGETLRFSSTIPYLQAELDTFLQKNVGNSALTKSVLTRSREGRHVELLKIGNEAPGVQPVLVTGRHHANESIASYVLEGFLQEAISDSPSGVALRKKYVVYAIPFVDKDGVENGDQGKNRQPHDHNRDYGEKSIYPEIIAIRKLDAEKDFRFTFDIHCPTLVINIHQRMYFTGIESPPEHNLANLTEFAKEIKQRLPKGAPWGPVVLPKPPTERKPMNSHYFGFRKDMVMVATLEVPFAPPKTVMHPDALREYGKAILDAWVNTTFLESDTE